jgi:hypothetical protein
MSWRALLGGATSVARAVLRPTLLHSERGHSARRPRASGHQRHSGHACGMQRFLRSRHPPVADTHRPARDLHDRPDFDGAHACPWNTCGDADRVGEIVGVDPGGAAERFAGLREQPGGDERFAVTHPDAGRRRRRLQRVGGQIRPTSLELMRERHGLRVHTSRVVSRRTRSAICLSNLFFMCRPPSVRRTTRARIDPQAGHDG